MLILKDNSYICNIVTDFKVIFMIVQFSVGNYLSFKELSTLSLVATNLKEAAISDIDSMTEMGDAIPAVLHGAAVYGANASGKSNFAKAFSTFKWLVVNSMKELQAGEILNVESFMLNATPTCAVGNPNKLEIFDVFRFLGNHFIAAGCFV